MKNKLLILLVIVSAFALGVVVGNKIALTESDAILSKVSESKEGTITVYTYYNGVDGSEIKHGYEYIIDRNRMERKRFDHGRLQEFSARSILH